MDTNTDKIRFLVEQLPLLRECIVFILIYATHILDLKARLNEALEHLVGILLLILMYAVPALTVKLVALVTRLGFANAILKGPPLVIEGVMLKNSGF